MARITAMSNKDWETEQDLRTYQDYLELKKDPKRMAAVKKLANEKLKTMAVVSTGGEPDGDEAGK